MNRRAFLQLCSSIGLGVSLVGGKQAYGEEAGLYNGRILVQFQADGGWDPTSLFDPYPMDTGFTRYANSAIRKIGNLSYAPFQGTPVNKMDLRTKVTETADFYDRFFANHYQRLALIKGISNETVDHGMGQNYSHGGVLRQTDTRYPLLSAILASGTRPDLALALVVGGGVEETRGLVAGTRVGNDASVLDSLREVAKPNIVNPRNATVANFQDSALWDNVVQDAIKQNLLDHHGQERLPQRQQLQSVLMGVRASGGDLDKLNAALPTQLSPGLAGQIEVAVAGFQTGLGVSASFAVGGFDTHGDHDNQQYRQMDTIIRHVDYLFFKAEQAGILDRLTVLVASDFGRGPTYNDGGGTGKGHYPITGMMVLGAGVRGNTIIGQTTTATRNNGMTLIPSRIDPVTLQTTTAPNGVLLTPTVVHQALRHFLGVEQSLGAKRYPFPGVPVLPLFT